MNGLALTLPVLWVLAWVPGLTPGAEVLAGQAQRATAAFLHPAAMALKALVLAPILEEVFYRGLILQLCRRYLPTWLAVMIPTLLFAATHAAGGLSNVVFAAVLGSFFSWLVIRTGSLYASVLCHAAVNLAAIFILRPVMMVNGHTMPGDAFQAFPLLMLAGSVGLAIGAIRVLRGETGGRAPVSALA